MKRTKSMFCIMAGFSYGAKKFDRLREAIKTSIIWSTSFCLVVGLVMAVFSTQIISQFTEGDNQMILVGQKSLFANGITFILFGFYTVYSSLFLALGKGAAGFFLGACRQGVCFVRRQSTWHDASVFCDDLTFCGSGTRKRFC